MSTPSSRSLILYEVDSTTIHSLEDTANLTGIPRRTILRYSRAGLVSSATDPDTEGWQFSEEALRTLRRIEQLRLSCGANLSGLKLILDLMDEIERLHAHLRFRR